VRWSLAAVTLAAVALTAIMGGQRYFYCRAMDQIMSETTCDCGRASIDDGDETAVGILNDCFEVRFLDRMVSFTVDGDFAVPATHLLAILPIPAPDMPPSNAILTGAEHPIRAGPLSPTASRSKLMVFLT